MDFVHLVGAEELRKAVADFEGAVNQFKSSVDNLEQLQRRHEQFLTEWIQRFEDACAKLK